MTVFFLLNRTGAPVRGKAKATPQAWAGTELAAYYHGTIHISLGHRLGSTHRVSDGADHIVNDGVSLEPTHIAIGQYAAIMSASGPEPLAGNVMVSGSLGATACRFGQPAA
ncbi:MAG: hypothetical protein ACREXO_02980 [Advenella sp.]